jgi:hypothetical protein
MSLSQFLYCYRMPLCLLTPTTQTTWTTWTPTTSSILLTTPLMQIWEMEEMGILHYHLASWDHLVHQNCQGNQTKLGPRGLPVRTQIRWLTFVQKSDKG